MFDSARDEGIVDYTIKDYKSYTSECVMGVIPVCSDIWAVTTDGEKSYFEYRDKLDLQNSN
ncbi:MAG: hypothetical protein ABF449_14355, partial [Ethanoligenens sp.]